MRDTIPLVMATPIVSANKVIAMIPVLKLVSVVDNQVITAMKAFMALILTSLIAKQINVKAYLPTKFALSKKPNNVPSTMSMVPLNFYAPLFMAAVVWIGKA